MKRCLLASLVFLAAVAMGRADGEIFSQSLSPEDFAAAGLNRLSPAELKRLDELVKAHQNGVVAAARQAAEEARQAKLAAEAETKAAKADAEARASKAEMEARAARAEAEATASKAQAEAKAAKTEAAESKKSSQGFFAKAKVLLVPGTKIEYAVITTTVVGEFEGWNDHTIFVLANGQHWQVANSGEHYFTPPKENVEVQIAPAHLGGFWMYFPRLGAQVRVKLIDK